MGRCFGITRSLHRCSRKGDWKLFCSEHRRQPVVWLFVFVFTVLGGLASMQSAWWPTRERNSKILGSRNNNPISDSAKYKSPQSLETKKQEYLSKAIPNPKPSSAQPQLQPSIPISKVAPSEVKLRFVYPKSPALVIMNDSDSIVSNIKWTVALWNIDRPDRNDPLPIPVSTFDWLKDHRESGPIDIFNRPTITPLLKYGDRLFGSASLDCPLCARGRTYIVYIVWGQGGWFSEVEGEKSGVLIIPKNFLKESREKYFKGVEAIIPESSRQPINER